MENTELDLIVEDYTIGEMIENTDIIRIEIKAVKYHHF